MNEFILFKDDFENVTRVSATNWRLPVFPTPTPGPNDPNPTFIGRTQFRVGTFEDTLPVIEDHLPVVANGIARLRLDTLNPILLDPPENPTGIIASPSLFGTEIIINRDFNLGSGLAFEATVRINAPSLNPSNTGTTQRGLVASLFSFIDQEIAPNQFVFDEIDFEFLTNDINNAENSLATPQVLTNVFDDDPPGPGSGRFIEVDGLDLTEFNTFRVEWHPDSIVWKINGTEILTRMDIVPDEAQTIRLNFWAPEPNFSDAFDGSLQPVARRPGDTNSSLLARNRTLFYEVEEVLVERLDPEANNLIWWRNNITGDNGVWLMNGPQLDTTALITPNISPSSGWDIKGTGDFDGDNETDILWGNDLTGQSGVWMMDGAYLKESFLLSVNISPSSGWEIKGTGDFNGDNQTDILWGNDLTGQSGAWLMNGTELDEIALIEPNTSPSSGWEIKGTGDFNDDNQTDILWENDLTGQNGTWLMNGTELDEIVLIEPSILPNSDWEIKGTGDFNQDNQIDILWGNGVTGQTGAWLMNGTELDSIISIGSSISPGSGWNLHSAG